MSFVEVFRVHGLRVNGQTLCVRCTKPGDLDARDARVVNRCSLSCYCTRCGRPLRRPR